MGEKIDGRKLAASYKEDIKKFIGQLCSEGMRVPCLAAILVGDDGGSIYYLNNQNKVCKDLGLETRNLYFKEDVTEEELLKAIDELNNDKTVDGIMLLLPLPKHIDEKKVTSSLSPEKDVDGLTEINTGRFYRGEECFVPCTPLSIINLIKSTGIDIAGKNAVVLGRSNIVGKPAAQLLLKENATITICHSRSTDLKAICSSADILVCAIGKPKFITAEYVKEGAIVIDVGTSSVDGKITGDVNFDEVFEKASCITPVPGGVGAVTTTMLILNTCMAYKNNVY